MSRSRALLLGPALLLTACTSAASDTGREDAGGDRGSSSASAPAGSQAASLTEPTGVTVVPGEGGSALAAATSEALYAEAPVVVAAPAGDLAAQARAASVAVAMGAPLLLSPAATSSGSTAPAPSGSSSPSPAAGSPAPADEGDATAAEVERLGAEAVLAVGADAATWAPGLDDVDVVAAPEDPAALAELAGVRLGDPQPARHAGLRRAVAGLALEGTPVLAVDGTPAAAGRSADGELPQLDAPARLDGVVVLASAYTPDSLAAIATARAAGATVHVLTEHDPRASAEVVEALAADEGAAVLALGDPFGAQQQLAQHVAVARTGVQLPGGGQLVLPGKMYVALYGHPGTAALGVLGEQGVDATVARAKQVAAEYEAAGATLPVIPTFEIITTIASAALGDGDYSDEASLEHVRPLVEAAGREGIYVLLDLQPGYDDFLTQAKMYEELLALPHVGLALDPEWRLKPGERHLRQIGRVGADEVNTVVTWLADLTRDRKLPQKMLLLHQFKTFMLENRERIDTTRPELSVVTQMDGHGPPATKFETWNVIRPGAPEGMRFGWKNFYDEDSPTLTPAQTLKVEPQPVFVSYQ